MIRCSGRRFSLPALVLLLSLGCAAVGPVRAQDGGLPAATGRFGNAVVATTPWGAMAYTRTGDASGPTVLVFAAEGAARRALDEVWDWPLKAGRLVVVTGGVPFEGDERLRSFIEALHPDWTLDLAEDATGRTTVFRLAGKKGEAEEACAAALAERLNRPIEEKARRYKLAEDGIRAKPVAVVANRLGVPVLTVVSLAKSPATKKMLPVSLRVRHHRLLVYSLLADLKMIDTKRVAVDSVAPLAGQTRRVRVAMFDGLGAAGDGPPALDRDLGGQPDVLFRRVGALEIQNGALDNIDVLIQPGGSSARQAQSLGAKGRANVQKFLERGGGYVGICAGAYLASGSYDRSLKVASAEVVDRKNSYRGRADLWIELTPLGREVLGNLGTDGFLKVKYHNGPVLRPADGKTVSDFAPLAVFRTEVTRRGAKRGLMIGTPAIAAGHYGKGRVVTISPHPEQTPGLEAIVPQCVRWAAGRTPASATDSQAP